MTDRPPILLDFESRSRADLKAVGGRKYWEHYSSEVLCCCWHDPATGQRGDWLPGMDWPHRGRQLAAHNATGFDRFAAERLGWVDASHPWVDTSELARTAGLPGALDALGTRWLGLPKDKAASKFTKGLSSVRRPAGAKNPDAIPAPDWKLLTSEQKRELGLQVPITPEVMARVVPYCRSDVEIMAYGWPLLESWADLEPEVVAVDRAVNDRGVYFDSELAEILLEVDRENSERVIARVAKDLDWPESDVRSVAKSNKAFKQATGLPNSKKDTVAAALTREAPELGGDPVVYGLCKARQALASIVAGKLESGLRVVSCDGRLRDLIRYYAAHTGRWGGRYFQPHNLTRPPKYYKDWRDAEVEKWSDDDLCALVDAVKARKHRPSQAGINLLLRACLCAIPGHTFGVCDFSGVEARALAWCAGDERALENFSSGRDPYKVMAAQIYGIDYDSVDGKQRGIGKITELACLAGDTLVLTDRGPLPIMQVTLHDKLWDGNQWVTHRGLVTRGIRPVVDFAGVQATADHAVWCGTCSWYPFGKLAPDVVIRYQALATGSVNLPLQGIGSELQADYIASWCSARAAHTSIPRTCSISAQAAPLGARCAQSRLQGTGLSTIAVMPQLLPMMRTAGASVIDSQRSATDAEIPGLRSIRTMAAAVFACTPHGSPTTLSFTVTSLPYPAGMTPRLTSIERTITGGTSLEIFVSCQGASTRPTGEASRPCSVESTNWKPVYDISHAGPKNRFTILTSAGPLIVHNCGYGMGHKKFGANNGPDLVRAGLDPADVIRAWRDLHAPIVRFWRDLQDAFTLAVAGEESQVAGFSFTPSSDGRDVAVFLPSGRPIVYSEARVDSAGDISYLGRKGREHIYGGKITENVIQAMCRDMMAEALVTAEKVGLRPVLHVHDEIVVEVPEGAGREGYDVLHSIMTSPPDWAEGFPVGAAGFVGHRYRK